MSKAQDIRMAAIEDDAPQRQGNIGTSIDATEGESGQRAFIGHQLVVDARQTNPGWSNARLSQYGTAVVREMWAGTCGTLNANIAHRAAEQMNEGDRVELVDCPATEGNPEGHQIAVWHDQESGKAFNLDIWNDDPPHDPQHNVLTSEIAQPRPESKFEYSKGDVPGALANISSDAEKLQTYPMQKQIDSEMRRLDGREPMGRVVQHTPSYISPELMANARRKAQQEPDLASSLARVITREITPDERQTTEADAQRVLDALAKF